MNTPELIENGLGLVEGVEQAVERGYAYVPGVVSTEACSRLVSEAATLQIDQDVKLGDIAIPFATFFGRELAKRVMLRRHRAGLKSLGQWEPTDLGYHHRYRDTHGQDNANEKLLRATVTLEGSTFVNIFKESSESEERGDFIEADEFETLPGDMMLMRAPGLGDTDAQAQEIISPREGRGLILNLHMADDEIVQGG